MSMLHPAIIQRRDLFVSPSAMLFGAEWQHAIARSLGPFHPDGSRESIDSRLVRRWASGERVVPIWVISAVARMLESRVNEADAMRIRLSCAEAAIAVELQEFDVEQVTDHDIRIKHMPSADVFRFERDGRLIAGGYTHGPGPRTDTEDHPEIALLAESARHVARDRLSMTPRSPSPTNTLEITKAQGASRQVEAAIHALMRGDFDIAITLAGAAEGMLRRDGMHLFSFLRESQRVKDVPSKEWISLLNQDRDWLKHCNPNDAPTLTLTNFEAAIMIARAASKLDKWSPLMDQFKDLVVRTIDADPDDAVGD